MFDQTSLKKIKSKQSFSLNLNLCPIDLKSQLTPFLDLFSDAISLNEVVWNPWDKKSKTMSDLGDDEYKQMLCVDGAAIEKPITLKPGEEWTGRLEIAVVPSSFCSEDL